MTGRTHDLAAFTALVGVIAYLPMLPTMTLATTVTAFGANFIGGLFPDIDQPTSDMWDNFRLGPFVAKIVCPLFGGHRHVSHSLLGFLIIGVLSSFLLQLLGHVILIDMTIVWYSFMIGVASHLVTDVITKEGLPLLWPLDIKFGIPPLKALRIETGTWIEKLIVFPGLLILTGYIVYSNQSKFLVMLHQFVR